MLAKSVARGRRAHAIGVHGACVRACRSIMRRLAAGSWPTRRFVHPGATSRVLRSSHAGLYVRLGFKLALPLCRLALRGAFCTALYTSTASTENCRRESGRSERSPILLIPPFCFGVCLFVLCATHFFYTLCFTVLAMRQYCAIFFCIIQSLQLL